MAREQLAEVVINLLKNTRIAKLVNHWKLTEEQVMQALPILIDMDEQDVENDNYIISFYVTPDGQVKRQETISTIGQEKRFLNHVLSQSFNPVNFEMEKEYIKDQKRGEVLQEFSKILLGNSGVKGLYIHGPMGVGKTFTIKRFAKKIAEKGKNVVIISPSSLASKLKASFGDPEKQGVIVSLLKEVEYLFIDDIGSESITSWFRDEILFSILDARMEHSKTTFFTSNYDYDKLEKKEARISNSKVYENDNSKRLIERIRALTKPVYFEGENLRHK